MKTRIILADDHQILREGIRSILKRYDNVEVIGEASNGRDALRLVKELSPDVVIMDITMPDMNGIDATRKILALKSGGKIIALSMHHDKHFITEMFRAGASGYLVKDSAFDELEYAIRVVMEGKTYINPQIASLLVDSIVNRPPGPHPQAYTLLTEREREVLQHIAEGMSTKEIAESLHVSTKTIESHRRQVMGKLNIRSVADLTKFAIREGLIAI